jgi:hypothetical protein
MNRVEALAVRRNPAEALLPGLVWAFLARRMTGTIWRGVLALMGVNYIAFRGW